MELNAVEENEKSLIIEVKGETTTITNLLSKELWSDNAVVEAANIKEHPYLGEHKILVKTNRGSPRTALEKAATRVIDQVDDFRQKFKLALKKII